MVIAKNFASAERQFPSAGRSIHKNTYTSLGSRRRYNVVIVMAAFLLNSFAFSFSTDERRGQNMTEINDTGSIFRKPRGP
jgi:hypothetical protein